MWILIFWTNNVSKAVRLLTCIREVSGSTLNLETGCPDPIFLWFSSVRPYKYQDCTLKQATVTAAVFHMSSNWSSAYHSTLYNIYIYWNIKWKLYWEHQLQFRMSCPNSFLLLAWLRHLPYIVRNFFKFLWVGWGWVHLVDRPLLGLSYQPRTIDDDDECGAVGRMRIGRGNRSTRRKPAAVPLRPPQIRHEVTWARARAAAVESRRLIAWATARSLRMKYVYSVGIIHSYFRICKRSLVRQSAVAMIYRVVLEGGGCYRHPCSSYIKDGCISPAKLESTKQLNTIIAGIFSA
jgi:hypothetical protein